MYWFEVGSHVVLAIAFLIFTVVCCFLCWLLPVLVASGFCLGVSFAPAPFAAWLCSLSSAEFLTLWDALIGSAGHFSGELRRCWADLKAATKPSQSLNLANEAGRVVTEAVAGDDLSHGSAETAARPSGESLVQFAPNLFSLSHKLRSPHGDRNLGNSS